LASLINDSVADLDFASGEGGGTRISRKGRLMILRGRLVN